MDERITIESVAEMSSKALTEFQEWRRQVESATRKCVLDETRNIVHGSVSSARLKGIIKENPDLTFLKELNDGTARPLTPKEISNGIEVGDHIIYLRSGESYAIPPVGEDLEVGAVYLVRLANGSWNFIVLNSIGEVKDAMSGIVLALDSRNQRFPGFKVLDPVWTKYGQGI